MLSLQVCWNKKVPSVRHGFVIYVMKTFNGLNYIENNFCLHHLRILTDRAEQ